MVFETTRAVAQLDQVYNVSVIDIPIPTILNATDVIVRLNLSAICSSDLDTYHTPKPYLYGHENLGYVIEVGNAVQFLNVGDYVIIPDNLDNGHFTSEPDSYFPSSQLRWASRWRRASWSSDLCQRNTQELRSPITPSSRSRPITRLTLLRSLTTSSSQTYFLRLEVARLFPAFKHVISLLFSALDLWAFLLLILLFSEAPPEYTAWTTSKTDLTLRSLSVQFQSNFTPRIPEPNGLRRGVEAVGYEAENADGEVDASTTLHSLVDVVARKGGIGIVGLFDSTLSNLALVRPMKRPL
ncbi:alcohol dehydrogenase [Colletotrichum tofieldiae]|uniref:Alcohol dehydrogenase n=1 Tax=Colletotrichum tofieldiae TaxID=708197 RepID=A0A166P783_9PEZI|nr:alcohol dehydrogenase [Colletotrichum tofieldiae]